MAGLETIIGQIRKESEDSAARTTAAARQKAEEILAQARAEAEEECAAVREASKKRTKEILENCSFDAIFDSAREHLQDEVGKILFS